MIEIIDRSIVSIEPKHSISRSQGVKYSLILRLVLKSFLLLVFCLEWFSLKFRLLGVLCVERNLFGFGYDGVECCLPEVANQLFSDESGRSELEAVAKVEAIGFSLHSLSVDLGIKI